MSSVNYPAQNNNQTVRIFDEFYSLDTVVPADQYDAVYSFFKSIFTEDLAAKNFTVNLFRVAEANNRSVLELLAEMQGQDSIQINLTLCYYLNNLRSNTTLLGLGEVITPNPYAIRNILA